MPKFYVDEMDIEVDEYLNACNSEDIDDIVSYLVDQGYIKSDRVISTSNMSINEMLFEESLNKLHGKYTSLSKEDEDKIHRIASKF